MQEPFLDLLVELNWASGRVVREYTFLLDPPGMPAAAATEPITPPRAGAPARTSAAPAQRTPSATTATTTASPGSAASSGAGAGQYTVRRGDTLQRIATQYKPADVTLDQMLVALFTRNQTAFEGDNMNRLRAGAILDIPSATDTLATPAPEATKIVRMQASDWRTYRDRVAAAAPASAGGATRESAGRIGAAVEDRTPAAAPGSDKLRVSREAGTGKGGGAAEDAIARDQQLKDAQSRISALEKTIAEMQRAVELKNQTLAQLQAQAETAKGGKAPAATASTTPAPTTGSAATTAAAAPGYDSGTRRRPRRRQPRRRRAKPRPPPRHRRLRPRHPRRRPRRRRRSSRRASSRTSSRARRTGRSASPRSRFSAASPG